MFSKKSLQSVSVFGLLAILTLAGCASKPVPVAAPPVVAAPAPAPAPKAVIAIDQTPRGVQIPLPNTVLFQ